MTDIQYGETPSEAESDPVGGTPTQIIGFEIENEVVQEHRIVCGSHGQPGHHEHVYIKQGYDLCVKYAKKLDERTTSEKEREREIPFTIQTRVVSQWERAESPL